RERNRLLTQSRLEFVRTQELLSRFLPAPPAIVLDVGGGPGRYAACLATAGYTVTVLDPVPLHVEQAGAAGLDAVLGDARSLPWEDARADAVLCLGPLYHLRAPHDRLAALTEARRVLRPGGV